MIFKVNSVQETQALAFKLAQKIKETGGVIALSGELGAGKTTFVQGFAKALDIEDKIISPTFVLMRQHQILDTDNILFHLDLYRLEGKIDLKELGIDDILQNKKNIILIEWAEKAKDQLPDNTTFIKIKKLSESEREININ